MHERRKPAWPQFKECRSEAGEGGWQGARITCTVSEVPSCLGMMRVQIWKQAFFSSRTPARMPQLSTPLRVLEAAYLSSQCILSRGPCARACAARAETTGEVVPCTHKIAGRLLCAWQL